MNQADNMTESQNQKITGEVVKRTVKDSVFTNLFQDPKYLIQLYQALHPEDQDVKEESINNVTIKNILLDQCYNDLGFCIGDKLVILVEAQSTWTVNIVIREEYLENREQEVVNIMMTLFDDEYILKTYIESEKREAANRKSKTLAEKMYKRGDSIKEIAEFLDTSVEEVEEWLELVNECSSSVTD